MADRSLYCKNTILGFLRKKEPLFGGWKVVAFLGAGAFGCVFKLEREDLGARFVSALKVISLTKKVGDAGDSLDSLQDAISQEAKELVHLYSLGGHQNVVGWHNHQVFHIRDSESVTALMAVMMDYLPNNLAKEIKKGPIPWPRAMRILGDCLRGLMHIHSKQVIHRDIKPENIFINDDGMARIGDFGVARQVTDTSQAETRVGTPLYIAPEVIKDPYGHGYDFQVDVYSLGLVGYELLVGHLPFLEESKGNKNLMVKKRLSGAVITLPDTLPRGVRDVILGAVQYDPDRRYSSAAEFLEAVERVLASEGLDTVRPLPIVRVMPDTSGESGSSWKQVPSTEQAAAVSMLSGVSAPPAQAGLPGTPRGAGHAQEVAAPSQAWPTPGAAGSTGAPTPPAGAAPGAPPALASVVHSGAVNPPPASQPALRANGAPTSEQDHAPAASPRPAAATYRPPVRGIGAHQTQTIYGVDDPYETARRSAGINSWEVAACVATLGCVLSVYFRNDDAVASMVFVICNVLAAVYFILAVRRNRLLVLASFVASLAVGNYLVLGNVSTMLTTIDYVLLGAYGLAFLVGPRLHAFLGRS